MRAKPWVTAVAAILLCAAVAGCQKTFQVQFTNQTDEELTVSLQGPGEIQPDESPVALSPRGGQGVFEVSVDPQVLPANYQWRIDGRRGTVVVRKDSRKLREVYITESTIAP